MSPLPNYLSMECVTKEMKKVIGIAYKMDLLIFKNNNFHNFIDKADYERVGRYVLAKVKKQPAMFVKFVVIIKRYAKAFYKFILANNQKNFLAKMTNARLANLFLGYEKRYRQLYSLYFPVLSMENFLFEDLRNYIFGKIKDEKKAGNYLNTMITEHSAMVNWQENIAALKLAVKVRSNAKWASYFGLKNQEQIIKKVKDDAVLNKLIKIHEKNYFWLTRDYEDPILTFADFIGRFKEILKTDPAAKLKKSLAEEQKVKKDQQKIIKELKMERHIARLFQTMREGMYYKELRKTIVSKTLYYFDPILAEAAKRCGLTLNQTRHFKMSEVKQALAGKDFSQELSERIKLSVWLTKNGTAKVIIGKPAEKIFNSLVKFDKNTKILTGMPVAPGIARGPVKIILNPDSFHKVKRGDIIVTAQATPVFSTIIALSAGMVCDGGPGITSHPATLAREAGIPCIIGARFSMRILKDGDIVEVNGTKGVMKVIRRI